MIDLTSEENEQLERVFQKSAMLSFEQLTSGPEFVRGVIMELAGSSEFSGVDFEGLVSQIESASR